MAWMNSRKTLPPPRTGYLRPDRWAQVLVLPYAFSLIVHIGLLIVIGMGVRGCERGPAGFSDADGPVGLEMSAGDGFDTRLPGDPAGIPGQAPGDSGTTVETPLDSIPGADPAEGVADGIAGMTNVTAETPPAEVLLPKSDGGSGTAPGGTALPAPGSGLGAAPQGVPGGTGGTRSGSGSVRPGTGAGGQGQGGTGGGVPGAAFMGSRDVGTKVVFCIDASGSMTSNNAMAVAKSALISSLQALDERQQFLVIFYDDQPHSVILRQDAKPGLSFANDINKTLARQAIAGIRPGAGTNHLPALETALRMNPDVIFFLTDALEPPLWPRDLEYIKKLNGGRARIHSIEFGQGPELDGDAGNFLRKLAHQNQGTYRYHDVTRFKSPQ